MNNEESIIINRFYDWDKIADTRQCVVYSDYLNLNEYSLLRQNKDKFYCDVVSYNEIDNLERQIVAFLPDASFSPSFPVSLLKIEPTSKKYCSKLSHRDVLGSLMGLQIERKLIGDIFITDDNIAYVFVLDRISDFIVNSLESVGRTDVKVRVTSEINCNLFQRNAICKTGTVPSMRLDAIISEGANKSRNTASDEIKQGNVFVNAVMVNSVSYTCKENDIITIRHFGRLKIVQIGETNKSGRVKISYEIYK